MLQRGRKRTGADKEMDVTALALANIIQRDKATLAQDLPVAGTALVPQLHRKVQSPQNRPEQSREMVSLLP